MDENSVSLKEKIHSEPLVFDLNKSVSDYSEDEMDEFKVWLFRENIRISAERKEIDELFLRFYDEKKQFDKEMQQISKQIDTDKKRLQDEQLFFQKKLAILENAFKQLDVDRQAVVKERKALEADKAYYKEPESTYRFPQSEHFFFNGVNSGLALKKRYKDLIKIFHPDNLCGDTDTIQKINKEYEKMKEKFDYRR